MSRPRMQPMHRPRPHLGTLRPHMPPIEVKGEDGASTLDALSGTCPHGHLRSKCAHCLGALQDRTRAAAQLCRHQLTVGTCSVCNELGASKPGHVAAQLAKDLLGQ